MSPGRLVLARVAFAVFAVYLVLSVTFGFVVLTGDPNVASVRQAAAMGVTGENESVRSQKIQEAVDDYREARNLDDPVAERYVRWLVAYSTLDWGRSTSTGQPVTDLVADSAVYTLGYLVPGVLLGSFAGLVLGMVAALRRHGPVDRASTAVAYLALGLPGFWIASVLLATVGLAFGWDATGWDGTAPATVLARYVLPTAVLAVGVVAGQLRYARVQTLEYLGEDFVRLVRAKGAGDVRVARHVLRNAAVPLLSLFVAELLGLLVLNVYVVEYVFGIPGLGALSYGAIKARDLPLILGTTFVVVFAGVALSLVRDLAHLALDPRAEA